MDATQTIGQDGHTLADGFQVALAAHERGDGWPDLWAEIRADVIAMAAGDPIKQRRLVDRAMAILVSGDLDGIEPPTTDAEDLP